MVVFGLFHGLAYLPVILSWIGPQPYHSESEEDKKDITNGLSNGITAKIKVIVEFQHLFKYRNRFYVNFIIDLLG